MFEVLVNKHGRNFRYTETLCEINNLFANMNNNKKQKNKEAVDIVKHLLKRVFFIFMLRLIIPVVYLGLMGLAFYLQLYSIAYILFSVLLLCFFIFSVLLITNKLGDVLNNFWKELILYRLYYKGKYWSRFFGFIYLIISILAIASFYRMIISY